MAELDKMRVPGVQGPPVAIFLERAVASGKGHFSLTLS
jgi:hypothetical protein